MGIAEYARNLRRSASKWMVAGNLKSSRFSECLRKNSLALGLSHKSCHGEVKVISSSGHVYGGAFAVNYFLLKHQPWTLAIVVIYLIPILLLFEILIYKLIAGNRTRISTWLGLSACKVEQT
jgi:hypothetical protein